MYSETLTHRCSPQHPPEDWVVLSWRYELHLLSHAFPMDAADSDRLGVPEDDMRSLGRDGKEKIAKILVEFL